MLAREVIINNVLDIDIIENEINTEELKPSECLIETYVSLISPGTELSRVYGLKKGASYPVKPGYCSVGKVLNKGSAITQVDVGDMVLFAGPHASLQVFDYEHSDGGMLYRLDKNTSYEDGTFLMMSWIACNGILPAEVKLGDTVAIFGLGSLGLVASILYKQMGTRVIAIDPIQHRCDMALSFGVDKVVSVTPEQQFEEIMRLTNQQGADIVIDASGLSVCIEAAIHVAAVHGQVILLGSPRSSYVTDVSPMLYELHTKMLTVIGALNRRYPFNEVPGSRLNMKRTLKYLEGLMHQKIIDSSKFISHHIDPDKNELLKAYEGLMNKKDEYTMVVIDWKK